MNFFALDINFSLKKLNSSSSFGLNENAIILNRNLYGENKLSKKKDEGFFDRLFSAVKEPIMLILIFSFIITLGVNIGKALKTGDGDFAECIGILVAIVLSVSITLFMEGSSKKAFDTLNKLYYNEVVKVIRKGSITTIPHSSLVVGDIYLLEAGDKVFADGRLIESFSLSIDESPLTGESASVSKDANLILSTNTPLAERKNCVYSGTFVSSGSGKVLVTAVGDKTEIGEIAGNLNGNIDKSPLTQKLNRLCKIITIIGSAVAIFVFLFSVVKLICAGNLTFNNVQELFISCIVLIVAAVPEGLPTIVALSLALNMIKLAKENAIIKKMTATETAGAISVICSDKTGTITQNKMAVDSICVNESCSNGTNNLTPFLLENFIINSTAEISFKGGKLDFLGSATECALLKSAVNKGNIDIFNQYKNIKIIDREPFSSDKKYMTTTINSGESKIKFIKGAMERVLPLCNLTPQQKDKLTKEMETKEKNARRILCFAHKEVKKERIKNDNDEYIFDGFVSLIDPIRKEVYRAVSDCKRAGIKIKMLTGDNKITAFAIAKELKIVDSENMVINASDIEKLDDESFKKIIGRVSVIARSTPSVKLRVVKALKEMGEIVAVTGDGINDAPAIKHADIGISMGKTGSNITKEASDLVLLDDSFATVIKAISFGRNVYRNIQRFILFQLSVNLSALLLVTICTIVGLPSPFNTLQLLWINIIMDGPPALTLGLEPSNSALLNLKPVKKNKSIVNIVMLLRILFNGIFISLILILQYKFNFLCVKNSEKQSVIFTLFILFQLFNAFNCRVLNSESIFKKIGNNKIMLFTFFVVFLIHLFIVNVLYNFFNISPLSFYTLVKCVLTSFSIIVVSELYKLFFRLLKKKD